ncbi:DUF4143 domain-containing protein [Microcella alkalica]|nr:DUF4143 domain-containing protein [Microcella alkalica]
MPASDSSYLPRIADDVIARELATVGAVVIEGPRAVGKTATASRLAATTIRLDVDRQARELAELEPSLLLSGARPILLDEWQLVPALWDHIRRAVDDAGGEPEQFLLTGSAMPIDDIARHTGAGRISRIRMRTMSSFESGASRGAVSLRALLDGGAAPSPGTTRSLHETAELIARGGWPATARASQSRAERFPQAYLTALIDNDLPALAGRPRDPSALERFLTAYAQVTGAPIPLAKIVRRAFGDSTSGFTAETADRYRVAAERLMVIEDLPAWSPALRSRSRLVSTAKRYFSDPSIAAALLGVDSRGMVGDLNTMGSLFENLVVRDLRCYADAIGARTFHYRESSGALEADVIVTTPDGAWMAFEIKLGGSRIDEAAAALISLGESRVQTTPRALVVVIPSGAAFRRPDGVWVVPADQLGP